MIMCLWKCIQANYIIYIYDHKVGWFKSLNPLILTDNNKKRFQPRFNTFRLQIDLAEVLIPFLWVS